MVLPLTLAITYISRNFFRDMRCFTMILFRRKFDNIWPLFQRNIVAFPRFDPGINKILGFDSTTIENWAKFCKYWHFDNILGVDFEIWPKLSSKCEHFANVLRNFRNMCKISAIFCECFAKYEQNLSEVLRNFSILSKYWARGRISPEIIIGIWVLSDEISKRDMGLLKRNIGYGQEPGGLWVGPCAQPHERVGFL